MATIMMSRGQETVLRKLLGSVNATYLGAVEHLLKDHSSFELCGITENKKPKPSELTFKQARILLNYLSALHTLDYNCVSEPYPRYHDVVKTKRKISRFKSIWN